MDSRVGVNRALEPAYQLIEPGSHTLQSRDRKGAEPLRTGLIEAAVEAFTDASAPRLRRSRSLP